SNGDVKWLNTVAINFWYGGKSICKNVSAPTLKSNLA
ncbi:hypothetical protein A2U01_0057196, partial [Trifolium medium]|nr:hypothetical protein [Trifolium medium]